MSRILFPTDFSYTSVQAFKFALEYARALETKITVFHAYDPSAEVDPATQVLYNKIDIDNFRNKKEIFPPFELIKEQGGYEVPIRYIVKEGTFVDTLKHYITKKDEKIEMVVLGTTMTKMALFELFSEFRVLKILEDIHKPVIVVPDNSHFDGSLNNILFLVDYKEDEIEPLDDIIEQTNKFDAMLHVVHIDLAHGESIAPQMEAFRNNLKNDNYKNIKYVTIDAIDIKSTLGEYCEEFNIDIVCLVNHKRNFYQRMFTYSLTEDLIRNMNIPVMAVYRN